MPVNRADGGCAYNCPRVNLSFGDLGRWATALECGPAWLSMLPPDHPLGGDAMPKPRRSDEVLGQQQRRPSTPYRVVLKTFLRCPCRAAEFRRTTTCIGHNVYRAPPPHPSGAATQTPTHNDPMMGVCLRCFNPRRLRLGLTSVATQRSASREARARA